MSRGRSFEKYIFYLDFNKTGHGRKFKQMRLCDDFNAGPVGLVGGWGRGNITEDFDHL